MPRKAIPKSVRFEVFKRDKFTCQYCGASAPDVVLEIDHIKPVSKGGDNNIMNLVTSCRNCNRGKSNKELSDGSSVKIQKKLLDDIQERREQLEMMVEWRNALCKEIELEVKAVDDLFQSETKWGMNEVGKKRIIKLLKEYGFNEVYISCEIAISKYYNGDEQSWEFAFGKIGGVCYNRRKERLLDA